MRSRRRRAPSGVHKVKIIGEKKIRHAIDQIQTRNETNVIQSSTHSGTRITPIKVAPGASTGNCIASQKTEEITMLIRQEETEHSEDANYEDKKVHSTEQWITATNITYPNITVCHPKLFNADRLKGTKDSQVLKYCFNSYNM